MVLLEYKRHEWLDINTSNEGFQPITRDLFTNIVLYSDLPYYFNLEKNEVYRYSGYHYGYFYNKHERNNEVWMTLGLKKNSGFLMSFFYNIPNTKIDLRINKNTWKYYSYLFINSYIKKPFYNFNTRLDFTKKDAYVLSDICLDIQRDENVLHRPAESYATIDNLISNFDSKWSSVDNLLSCGYSMGLERMLKDHFVLSDRFMISSFFVNSYNNSNVLYPQIFFESLRYNTMFENFIDKYVMLFSSHITINSMNNSKYLSLLNTYNSYHTIKYFTYLNNYISAERNKQKLFNLKFLGIPMKYYFKLRQLNIFLSSLFTFYSSFIHVIFNDKLDNNFFYIKPKIKKTFFVTKKNSSFAYLLKKIRLFSKKYLFSTNFINSNFQQKWFRFDLLEQTSLFAKFNAYSTVSNVLAFCEQGLALNKRSSFEHFFKKYLTNFIDLKHEFNDLSIYLMKNIRNSNYNFDKKRYYKLVNYRMTRVNNFIGYANTCKIDKGWVFFSLNNLGYRYPLSFCDGGLGYASSNIQTIYYHYYVPEIFSNSILFIDRFLNFLSYLIKTNLNNCFDFSKTCFNYDAIFFDLMYLLYNYFNLMKGMDSNLYSNQFIKKNFIKRRLFAEFKVKKNLLKTLTVLKINIKNKKSFDLLLVFISNYIQKKYAFNCLFTHLISKRFKYIKIKNYNLDYLCQKSY